MNNSSGIFQVDGLLKAKLRGSGLEPYVEVVAHIDTESRKAPRPDVPPRDLSATIPPPVAGSSNGRTPDSGSGSWGSNPCPAASKAAARGGFCLAKVSARVSGEGCSSAGDGEAARAQERPVATGAVRAHTRPDVPGVGAGGEMDGLVQVRPTPCELQAVGARPDREHLLAVAEQLHVVVAGPGREARRAVEVRSLSRWRPAGAGRSRVAARRPRRRRCSFRTCRTRGRGTCRRGRS